MDNKIFREYDIRGIVGTQLLIENVDRLADAILTYFLQQKPNLKKIIVGMDGRISSETIKKIIIEQAVKLGLDVIDIGLCPSPVFYFSLFTTDASSGMIVTASHNPKEYNGIKICLDKKSVWGTEIQEIKRIYEEHPPPFVPSVPRSLGVGECLEGCPSASEMRVGHGHARPGQVTQYDAVDHYVTWLSNHFANLKNRPINVIIDCGNGTAGTVFPKLIKKMGWKNVSLLFEEVDGNFPNHEPDPTTAKNMRFVKEALQEGNYEFGLGLDGDCDRMNPMSKSGYLVPGDQMLAIYTKSIIKKFPKATIVFDIKSSHALIEALESYGAIPSVSPSGHSIIKENLRKHDAKIAGEISCHFFFNDRYFGYDDGIYAALRLFEILDNKEKSLNELVEELPPKISSPEYRIECREEDKKKIVTHVTKFFSGAKQAKLLTIDGVKAEMPYGWGLIRASNTQSVLCLRFESETQEGLKKVENDFITALGQFFTKQELIKHFGEK